LIELKDHIDSVQRPENARKVTTNRQDALENNVFDLARDMPIAAASPVASGRHEGIYSLDVLRAQHAARSLMVSKKCCY
jgi:hypothetical protein